MSIQTWMRLICDDLAAFKNFDENTLAKDANLKSETFLETRGGRDGHEMIRRMMGSIMTDTLAMKSNYKGTRGKESFEDLTLCTMIMSVGVINDPKKVYTQSDAKDTVQKWLKEAKKRLKLSANKDADFLSENKNREPQI